MHIRAQNLARAVRQRDKLPKQSLFFERVDTSLARVHYYFKLDPNIRNPKEVLFGRMEIEGLAERTVEPIKHFFDVLKQSPLSVFADEKTRIQDFLLNPRTVFGEIQGYYFSDQLVDLTKFVERLGYTREIYVCLELADGSHDLERTVFPLGVEGKNLQVWTSVDNRYRLLRIITNQFFLERARAKKRFS
jgi:hypothetical protein